MFKSSMLAAVAVCFGCVVPATGAFAAEKITFSGVLNGGYNVANGPFGSTANYNLQGTSYSVSLSYDPAAFGNSYSVDSCGTASGTSCYFTISAANPVTEVVTVNGVSQTYMATSGGFTLGGGNGPYSFNFSFQNSSGLSLSGYFQSSTSFFPNAMNVNNPALANVTNLALQNGGGTFNQSGTGYSLGANPTAFSTLLSAVPESATWAMMIVGFGAVGFAMRRQKVQSRVSYAV